MMKQIFSFLFLFFLVFKILGLTKKKSTFHTRKLGFPNTVINRIPRLLFAGLIKLLLSALDA